MTGETPDISEYLDFGFYDKVLYSDNAGMGPRLPGRWLGVSHRTGNLMCYSILTKSGHVVSRSTVQPLTELEKQTEEFKKMFAELDEAISVKMGDKKDFRGDKTEVEDWGELASDPLFVEEFQKIHNNPDIPEADAIQGDLLDDTYLNMELSLPRGKNNKAQYARVTKRLRDTDGIPIGTSNDYPIMDTCLYEVEYLDGYKESIAANELAIYLFSQVDEDGNRFVLFDEIVDHRTDGSDIKDEDAFIVSMNRGRRHKETTKGWE